MRGGVTVKVKALALAAPMLLAASVFACSTFSSYECEDRVQGYFRVVYPDAGSEPVCEELCAPPTWERGRVVACMRLPDDDAGDAGPDDDAGDAFDATDGDAADVDATDVVVRRPTRRPVRYYCELEGARGQCQR